MADIDLNHIQNLSTSELFEDEMLLRYLMQVIGINRVQARDKIIDDGFDSIATILSHYKYDVEGFQSYLKNLNKTFASATVQLLRVYYSPVSIMRFAGIIHYYNQSVHSFHLIPDPSFITRDKSNELSNSYINFNKDIEPEDDETEVIIPELTGSSTWVNFRDKFLMKLSLIKGARGIPLDYVLDDTPRPVIRRNTPLIEVEEVDIDDENIYRTVTTHSGADYNQDNSQVWKKLKACLLGKSEYNHISTYDRAKDGRGGWLALKQFYEGEDFKERNKTSAFSKLTNTFYRGDTGRFNFEKYVKVHKDAHKLLEDAEYNGGAGIDNATKCYHFISGIKDESGLGYALSAARSNAQYKDFVNLVSFLSAEVDYRNDRRKQQKTGRDRNVSGANASDGNKTDGSKSTSKYVDGKRLYAKVYPKAEFAKMTKKQRRTVIELNREKNKNQQSGNQRDNKSTVSSVTMDDLTLLGDAIVSKVTRFKSDSDDDNQSSNSGNETNSKGNKKRAASGSVGEYIANAKKKKSNR